MFWTYFSKMFFPLFLIERSIFESELDIEGGDEKHQLD